MFQDYQLVFAQSQLAECASLEWWGQAFIDWLAAVPSLFGQLSSDTLLATE